MSNEKNSTSNAQQPAEAPGPTASDVVTASAGIVKLVSHLPPQLQLRALGSAATALGLDKEQRGGSTRSNTQQRSGNNSQQRNTR